LSAGTSLHPLLSRIAFEIALRTTNRTMETSMTFYQSGGQTFEESAPERPIATQNTESHASAGNFGRF